MLKIPRARSERWWERFLTLFRSGEAVRQFFYMEKLNQLGLNGPRPLLAAEKRSKGVVVDSFYIYSAVNGRDGKPKDLPIIVQTLVPLYKQGYCRADPKVGNHIISGEDVYLIDFRIKRPLIFGKIRRAMEFSKLAGTIQLAQDIGRQTGCSYTVVNIAWIANNLLKHIHKIRRKIKKRMFNAQ